MQTDQKKLFENYAVNLFEIEEGRFIYFIWGEERGWILPKEYQDQWLVWLGEKSFWTAFSLLEEAWLKYYRKEDYSFINLAGESYRDCLLSYSFSPHGYCCEVHFPDGEIFYTPSERHFSRALDVAKKIIDDHHDNDCTSIKDNDLGIYINPDDFSLLPRRLVHFEHLLGDEKSPLRQLAMLLMMSFDDQGTTRFFRQFLQDIFGFKTGFLTRHLNMLMRMGIMNYKEYPNSDYPLEFRIGPAWLDIAGAGESLNFEESEIQALLEGESFGKDKSYFEGLPHSVFSNQFNNIGEQIFQHSKGAFITYFQDNEYPQYRSRWHSGVWEHYAYESPEHCGEKIEYMTWREFKKFCQEYYSQPIVFDYKRTN